LGIQFLDRQKASIYPLKGGDSEVGSRTMKWIFGPLPESSGANSTTTPGQLATRSYKASNPARSATARS
jgi:hypothetical protein